jgi:hypothetical protein
VSKILTKQELSKLIKEQILWPGWDYHLKETVKAVDIPTGQGVRSSSHTYYSRVEENVVNQELDAVVEILIDQLYQRYLDIENWVTIFDPYLADSDKECVAFYAPKHGLQYGDRIRVYNSLNYTREFEVLNSPGDGNDDYILVASSYYPEDLTDTSYYTIVSPDGYVESAYKYFEPAPVKRCDFPTLESPMFLPLLGQKVGYTYDPSKSIAVNRKFITNAIDIYRIKGSITSIKRVMRLLGYDCEVYEPHVDIFRYNLSTYNGPHRIQTWDYYHHGVFEIVTEGIPLSAYKAQIASTVQPAGTRMVSAVMLPMNPVAFVIGTGLPHDQKSVNALFMEIIVKAIKAGDRYDGISPRRSRSGSREVIGFYKDIGLDIYAEAFRRVWDSHIFTFENLSDKVWKQTPANIYSKSLGVKSGPKLSYEYEDSEYDEQTPFDRQPSFEVEQQQLRLPQRSVTAKRSGLFVKSGHRGTGTIPLSRVWIKHHGPVLSDAVFSNDNCTGFDRSLVLDLGLVGGIVPEEEGSRFDEDRVLSGNISLFGFELTIESRADLFDWFDRLPYMYDDECRLITVSDQTQNLVWDNQIDFGFLQDPVIAENLEKETISFDDGSRSGLQTAYGFYVQPAKFWDQGTLVKADDSTERSFDSDRRSSGGEFWDFSVDIIRDPERWDRQSIKETQIRWEEKIARSYSDTANLIPIYDSSYNFVPEPFDVWVFPENGFAYFQVNQFDQEDGRRSGLGIAQYGFDVKVEAFELTITDWVEKRLSLYSDKTPLVRMSTLQTNYVPESFFIDLGLDFISQTVSDEIVQDQDSRSGSTYFEADVQIVTDLDMRDWTDKLNASYSSDVSVVTVYSATEEFMWERFDVHVYKDSISEICFEPEYDRTERSGTDLIVSSTFDVTIVRD